VISGEEVRFRDQTESRWVPTYGERLWVGCSEKKLEMVPCDIHPLTIQTGKRSEMPKKGTMFGWRRNFQTTASFFKDWQSNQPPSSRDVG
jgi:hypothetical protein